MLDFDLWPRYLETLSAVGGRRDVFLFSCGTANKRKVLTACGAGIPSLRVCALQLDIVEEMAGGRQEARNHERGRRKDGTTFDPRTPRKGRPQASQAAALSTHLQFPPAAHSGLPKKGIFNRQNLFRGFVPACHNVLSEVDTTANCWSLNRSCSPLMGWSSF